MTGTSTRRAVRSHVPARLIAAGAVVLASAAAAMAQGSAAVAEAQSQVVLVALILVGLLPIAEALFYRLHLGVRFVTGLGLCALLDLAAYGATVAWVHFLPGGVNPWFARLAGGDAVGYSAAQAAIAALLYAAVFLAVKVPVLSMWLHAQMPDRRLTGTVLLVNLLLFFALSAAMALLTDSAAF